jgi:hypothetical protein
MKTVMACFLSLVFAIAARTLARAQQEKGPAQSQYIEDKTLPLPQSPGLMVHFLAYPEPLGEPPLVQWNSGLKVTDAAGKTLFEGPGGRYWHMPFVQDVIVVHGEPVILIGDSSSLSAIRYSSGNFVDAGSWVGWKVELQPLNNGDFKILVSAQGSGYEDLPNVFQWDGVHSREDSEARATLLKQVVREASDEVENSPDIQPPANLGNQHRWIMDCFRALNAAVILGGRADALHVCSRARERIEKSPPEWKCGNTQPDCNARSRQLELDQLDSGVKARTMASVSSPD